MDFRQLGSPTPELRFCTLTGSGQNRLDECHPFTRHDRVRHRLSRKIKQCNVETRWLIGDVLETTIQYYITLLHETLTSVAIHGHDIFTPSHYHPTRHIDHCKNDTYTPPHR